MNVVKIDIRKIVPDENQPRKFFDEIKMASLKGSIKTHGIKSPLSLEVQDDGTFLIIDGERRWRTAKELGIKEIPAILEVKQDDVSRKILQFHLQGQHESWLSVEQAMIVSSLAEQLEVTIEEMGKILSITPAAARMMMSFGKVIDKKNFERSRLGLRNAGALNGVVISTKKAALAAGIDFDRAMAKKLENAIYTRVSQGEEVSTGFFTKIKDSLKQSPSLIQEFIENDSLTVDKLFSISKVKGVTYLRKIVTGSGWLSNAIDTFFDDPTAKISSNDLAHIKRAHERTKEFLVRFGE